MSRSLRTLQPDVALVVGEWLRICNSKGVAVLVYCTRRTLAEQAALYSKGRDENGRRIPGESVLTNAAPGSSFHNYGMAVDAAPWEFLLERGQTIRKKLDWTPFETNNLERRFRVDRDLDHLDDRWRVMVDAGDEVGLEWAGRWSRFIEYVHWQLTGGQTIAELKRSHV